MTYSAINIIIIMIIAITTIIKVYFVCRMKEEMEKTRKMLWNFFLKVRKLT